MKIYENGFVFCGSPLFLYKYSHVLYNDSERFSGKLAHFYAQIRQKIIFSESWNYRWIYVVGWEFESTNAEVVRSNSNFGWCMSLDSDHPIHHPSNKSRLDSWIKQKYHKTVLSLFIL